MSLQEFDSRGESVTSPEQWQAEAALANVASLDMAEVAPLLRSRVVIFVAHPDDEGLGAAGLMTAAAERGARIQVVLATAGEGSHPGSTTLSPPSLGRARIEESRAALAVLAPQATVECWDVPDGEVRQFEDPLTARLVTYIGDGRDCTVVSTYRHDGHSDHEAAGRIAGIAAARTGSDHWEFPLWMWHWGSTEDAPWAHALRLQLPYPARMIKRRAVACYRTQVEGLSNGPGDEALLGVAFLQHAYAGSETFFRLPALRDGALDELHQRNSDPWNAESSWFEERKRRIVLSLLPAERYRLAVELGCSTGVLARALADRCERVIGIDSSSEALRIARGSGDPSTVGTPVEYRKMKLPGQWPSEKPDLAVVSEFAYFLSPAQLEGLTERLAVWGPATTVVLCNWRHPIHGWALDAVQVRERFQADLPFGESAHYRERDFEISIFCGPERLPSP